MTPSSSHLVQPTVPAERTFPNQPSPSFLRTAYHRVRQGGASVFDQAFSVGGMFLANVALARTVSKGEYGLFTLSYSVFTFLSGLHNAALLEAYTVYGSGRYRERYDQYAWLIWNFNARLCVLLTIFLVSTWSVVHWLRPNMVGWPLLGMGITAGSLLTASLLRRMFYVQRKPFLAARFSSVFLVLVAILLWASCRFNLLTGFSIFVLVTLGWVISALMMWRFVPKPASISEFRSAQPNYRSDHWVYSRWVLATAFVFQLTTQGYYWVVAGLLSLKNVAELRAIYMLVAPVEQIFTAVTLIILPMLAVRYAAREMSEFLSVWRGYLLVFLAIGIVYVSVTLLAGAPVMHLLYQGKFDNVGALFVFIAFVPAIMGIGHTFNAALKAAERPNAVLYGYLVGGATTACVGVPLVLRLGLKGAVLGMIASAIAYSGTLGVQFWLLIRLTVSPAASGLKTIPADVTPAL